MNCQFNMLKLVYPPISNQEAEWIKDDLEVREQLKGSHLYMIVQRAEAVFAFDDDAAELELLAELTFSFVFEAGEVTSAVKIDFRRLLDSIGIDIAMMRHELEIELGTKMVRIWKLDPISKARISVVHWFTTEKLLYDKWRGADWIIGLDNCNELARYWLHYVGISKKNDSLSRLVVSPHDKRVRILSNEESLKDGTRLTDEMILLFFRVEGLRINIAETASDLDSMFRQHESLDQIRIIADAEKAFVSVLQSHYNEIKFANYPKSKDGLYESNLARYGYVLDEGLSLVTQTAEIRGGFPILSTGRPDVDLILIEGDVVSLMKGSEGQ
jgi:hypothetical protein